MFMIVLFLLSNPTTTSPAVPFYCRRFKADCSVRRDSICCREENIATTERETEAEELKKDEDSEDNLVASPSIIEEVVVAAPNETLAQNNLIIASTTSKPGRPIPRFCKLLKFDCKKRSNPICCKDVVDKVIQIELVQKNEKSKESETDAGSTEAIIEVKSNNGQDDDNAKREEAKQNDNFLENFTRKKSFTPTKHKNNYAFQPSSLKFSKRPSLYSSGKSPLCKIVNCSKAYNKKHKCCREEVKQKRIEKLANTVGAKIISEKEFTAKNESEKQEEINTEAESRSNSVENVESITGTKITPIISQKAHTEHENNKADIKPELDQMPLEEIKTLLPKEEETKNLNEPKKEKLGESLSELNNGSTDIMDEETTTKIAENLYEGINKDSTTRTIQQVNPLENNKSDENQNSPQNRSVKVEDDIINPQAVINDNNEDTTVIETTETEYYQNTEIAVTETMETETSTVEQEQNTLQGIRIEDEPSLFDSIMFQLLHYNISNLETSDDHPTAFTEIFTANESHENTTLFENFYTTNMSDSKPKNASSRVFDQIQADTYENETISTLFEEITETVEETDAHYDESTSTEKASSLQLVFSEPFETLDGNNSVHGLNESESDEGLLSAHDNKEKIAIDENEYALEEEEELLEVDSSNKVYGDKNVSKKITSHPGNLVPSYPVKNNNQPAPYTVISLPGYSNLRQPFVLQYPGLVTATITRVSKSVSW